MRTDHYCWVVEIAITLPTATTILLLEVEVGVGYRRTLLEINIDNSNRDSSEKESIGDSTITTTAFNVIRKGRCRHKRIYYL